VLAHQAAESSLGCRPYDQRTRLQGARGEAPPPR
jgi:hypothetical protein